MSDTNQVQLNYVTEVTSGITPATPTMRRLRTTGHPDLAYNPETIVSNEIVPGRQVQDVIPVGAEAGGSVEFEAVFFDHDDLIAGALYSVWVEQNKRTDADNLTVIAGEYNFNTGAAFKPGDIVHAHGFGPAANNGTKVAAALTSATKVVVAGLAIEAAPPDNAEIRVVGFRGAVAGFAMTTIGFANLTATGFNFLTGANLSPGQWVFVSGFAVVNANGWYRIAQSGVAAGQLTFDAAGHVPALSAGTGDTVSLWFGDYVYNASTRKSFSLERRYTDHTPETFEYFTGMHVNEMQLTLEPKAIVTGSLAFQGFSSIMQDSGRFAGAVDFPSLLATALNTSSNVGQIRQGGLPVVGPNFVLGITLNTNNNLRFLPAIQVFGAAGVGAGEFNVSGSLNTYFGNKMLAQQVIDGEESSFDMRFTDTDLHSIMLDVPRLKFTAGAPTVPGKNDDVTVDLEYQALATKGALSYTLMINRFWATAVTV